MGSSADMGPREAGCDGERAWLAELARTLGERAEELLERTWPNGLVVRLLYRPEGRWQREGIPGAPPWIRGARAAGSAPDGWEVRTVLRPEAGGAELDALVEEEAGGGAQALWVVPGGEVDEETVLRVMRAASRCGVRVVWACHRHAPQLADLLAGEAACAGRAELAFDPFTPALLPEASAGLPWEEARALLLRHGKGPVSRLIAASGAGCYELGAVESTELAVAIAAFIAWLRLGREIGMEGERIAAATVLELALDSDIFATAAKLRAARRLWATVTEAVGAGAIPPAVHARGGLRAFSRLDPWTNALRATLQAVGGALGGADALTLWPYDVLSGPSPRGRRLARHIHHVLKLEGHLHRVVDPAAGSGYLADLTDQIARKAWSRVQAIERAGGLARAIELGMVQGWLDEEWQARSERLAHRREILVGVNGFVQLNEREPEEIAMPVIGRRLAEPFERFQLLGLAYRARSGRRPRALACCLGAPRDVIGRLDTARQLLTAGGFELVESGPLSGPEEAVRRWRQEAADRVVLVASDAGYRRWGEAVARALREAGCAHLDLVAGSEDWPEGVPHFPVDELLYEGMPLLGLYVRLYLALGVEG